ncbi:MAG TPA: outer membrane beta-barrel protein [Terracidiphilus sp.]|nr:outer membrane beta-barrel protein [Terracidiphilus sp.]
MKSFYLAAMFAAVLVLAAQPTRARAADKGDVYFGYSRVGANLYAANTSGMNGWQAAVHVKPIPFVGIEGDVSHYSQNSNGYSEQVTQAMFGPRVTVHALGFYLFAHGLGGFLHQNATLTTFPSSSYNAVGYALGGGADLPIFLGLKVRGTVDYLGNSNEPGAGSRGPQHYRAGVGLAYHF